MKNDLRKGLKRLIGEMVTAKQRKSGLRIYSRTTRILYQEIYLQIMNHRVSNFDFAQTLPLSLSNFFPLWRVLAIICFCAALFQTYYFIWTDRLELALVMPFSGTVIFFLLKQKEKSLILIQRNTLNALLELDRRLHDKL